jgi:rare lipoprotein A (peptidoglycan hydrolase)
MKKLPAPAGLVQISPIYQFDIEVKDGQDKAKPLYVQISYTATSSSNYKQIYYFDKNRNGWQPLPTSDDPSKDVSKAPIHLGFARLAVFENPNLMAIGEASWYTHKNGLFAASPDFPAGSRLRVFSMTTGKFVDVTVNDFGPDRAVHPERVIDLDKPAFARLSDVRGGRLAVRIEPLILLPTRAR